ncbi:MAG: antitoxin family protein [Planctomycetota bacterium]|nr:antitoxin family protein [Planctomycetota bacterium]MDA1143148.1 antitoxin family protein [Planctomycetota bacterium]
MAKIIEAVFEKGVFRPREPVSLRDGQAVKVMVPDTTSQAPGIKDELLRQYFGAWRSGDSRSADNEGIDADLVQEYGNNHDPEA